MIYCNIIQCVQVQAYIALTLLWHWWMKLTRLPSVVELFPISFVNTTSWHRIIPSDFKQRPFRSLALLTLEYTLSTIGTWGCPTCGTWHHVNAALLAKRISGGGMRDTRSCSIFRNITWLASWYGCRCPFFLHIWNNGTVMQSVSSFTSANYSVCVNGNLCKSSGAALALLIPLDRH